MLLNDHPKLQVLFGGFDLPSHRGRQLRFGGKNDQQLSPGVT